MKNLILCLMCVFLYSIVNTAVAEPGFSEANNALFDSPHLQNIHEKGTISYAFHRSSVIDQPRDDTIKEYISNIRNTGRRDVSFKFFTGKYNRPYKAMENKRGNPVFVLFLEYDIHEMQAQTGGEWRYFQRRIRWALAQGPQKKMVDIQYKGKTIKATQYAIQPYINDPKNARYKLYANKYYIFTLSDKIPGGIYQVKTVVPDGKSWKQGSTALVEESITFTGFKSDSKTK